jgi:hypothetical protein
MRIRIVLTSMLGLGGTLICLVLLLASAPAQPRPGSYRAAVLEVLRAHQIDIQEVTVVDGCAPSYQFCRTYAGAVTIETTRTVTGQIACAERWTTCTLTVRALGIAQAPLPDVRDPLVWRWEQLQAALIQWVRGLR